MKDIRGLRIFWWFGFHECINKDCIENKKTTIFLGWFKGGALDGISTEVFDTYPLVLKHYNDIDAHPEIRKWMETRYAKKY